MTGHTSRRGLLFAAAIVAHAVGLGAPSQALANPPAGAAHEPMHVRVDVVSSCVIATQPLDAQRDVRTALGVSCAERTGARIASAPARTTRAGDSFALATINF